ncbi:MAG: phosphopantetheine-binding protein, partial [Dolichospermum sp.]
MNLKRSYTAESIQTFLVSHLAEVIGVPTAEIDVHENLENYGLD